MHTCVDSKYVSQTVLGQVLEQPFVCKFSFIKFMKV